MLRPEDLQLRPDEHGPVEIIDREYFGHDQLLRLRLPSGLILRSRLLSSAGDFHPRQRVAITLQPDVAVIYPSTKK